jgi:hypothetical protein
VRLNSLEQKGAEELRNVEEIRTDLTKSLSIFAPLVWC